MKVKGRNIIVTGGASGLGREIVLMLLKMGAIVLAVDINKEGLEETKKISENNENLFCYIVNLANQESVVDFKQKIIDEKKEIDAIINNAGIIQPFIEFKDLSIEKIKKIMDINFFGVVFMTKTFLPLLLKRPEAHILNVSSMGGFFPFPKQSIYGASKAAVKLLSEALILENKNTNVNITVAIPGGIATDIMKNSELEGNSEKDSSKMTKLILTPKKAAKIIIRGMEKNKKRIYVGKDSKTINILYKIFPNTTSFLVNKFADKFIS